MFSFFSHRWSLFWFLIGNKKNFYEKCIIFFYFFNFLKIFWAKFEIFVKIALILSVPEILTEDDRISNLLEQFVKTLYFYKFEKKFWFQVFFFSLGAKKRNKWIFLPKMAVFKQFCNQIGSEANGRKNFFFALKYT